jgi:hypothetical protein
MTLDQVLLIVALVCFVLAAFGVSTSRFNLNLVALGLAAYILTMLV